VPCAGSLPVTDGTAVQDPRGRACEGPAPILYPYDGLVCTSSTASALDESAGKEGVPATRGYAGGASGILFALDRATGEPVWTFEAPAGFNGWPAIAGDMLLIGAGVGDAPRLIALRLGATGSLEGPERTARDRRGPADGGDGADRAARARADADALLRRTIRPRKGPARAATRASLPRRALGQGAANGR